MTPVLKGFGSISEANASRIFQCLFTEAIASQNFSMIYGNALPLKIIVKMHPGNLCQRHPFEFGSHFGPQDALDLPERVFLTGFDIIRIKIFLHWMHRLNLRVTHPHIDCTFIAWVTNKLQHKVLLNKILLLLAHFTLTASINSYQKMVAAKTLI